MKHSKMVILQTGQIIGVDFLSFQTTLNFGEVMRTDLTRERFSLKAKSKMEKIIFRTIN